LSVKEVFLEKDGARAPMRLAAVKPHKRQLLIHLDGVEDINDAKKWIGAAVCVAEGDLPPLADNEYYYYQVVGMDVFDTKGARIGTIARLWPTPGGDLYVVEDGEKEYLIPVVKEIIAKIDFDAGRVIVDPPEGLLEL
jgi:16S rRNA processing protein RimM